MLESYVAEAKKNLEGCVIKILVRRKALLEVL